MPLQGPWKAIDLTLNFHWEHVILNLNALPCSVYVIAEAKQPASFLKKLILVFLPSSAMINKIAGSQHILWNSFFNTCVV